MTTSGEYTQNASTNSDDNFDCSEFFMPPTPRMPPIVKEPPKRLPNGRFMSKSQLEMFQNGVPLDEIIRLAAVADNEKKQKAIAETRNSLFLDDNCTPPPSTPKKPKPKRKPKPPIESNNLNTNPIKVENSNSTFFQSSLQQQQPMVSNNLNSCIKMINGQPVIQARLERVQNADGTTMTVAVLPADLQNLLRAAGLALPQQFQQQQQQSQPPPISNSPNLVVCLPPASSSPTIKFGPNVSVVDHRYAPIQPKSNIIRTPTNGLEFLQPKPQAVILPSHLPTERFTFRLSADDERTVAELTKQILFIQSLPKRSSVDETSLAKLEERRRSILHSAASNQFQAMSLTKSQQNSIMVNTPSVPAAISASSSQQIVQIGGVQYLAVDTSAQRPVLNLPQAISTEQVAATSYRTQLTTNRDGAAPSTSKLVNANVNVVSTNKGRSVEDTRTIFEKRCARIKERIAFDEQSVAQPDCDTPFRDRADVVERLLPYRLYDEPNPNEKLLVAADSDLRSFISRCRTKMGSIYDRFFKVLNTVTPMSAAMDNLIITDLMLKDEKEAFEEERQNAVSAPESYCQRLCATPEPEIQSDETEILEASLDTSKSIDQIIQTEEITTIDLDTKAPSVDVSSIQEPSRLVSPALPTSPNPSVPTQDLSTSIDLSSTLSTNSDQSSISISKIVDNKSENFDVVVASTSKSIDTALSNLIDQTSSMKSSSSSSTQEICCGNGIEAKISVKVVIKRRMIDSEDTKPSTSSKDFGGKRKKKSRKNDEDCRDFSTSIFAEEDEAPRVPPLKIRLRCNNEEEAIDQRRNSTNKNVHSLGLDSSDSDDDEDGDVGKSTLSNEIHCEKGDAATSILRRQDLLSNDASPMLDKSDTSAISQKRDSLSMLRRNGRSPISGAASNTAPIDRSALMDSSPISQNDDDDEGENSATTTSPGDSGQEETNLNDENESGFATMSSSTSRKIDNQEDGDRRSIPRLKIFRSSNFFTTTTTTTVTTTTNEQRLDDFRARINRRRIDEDKSIRSTAKITMDNEASDDDDNE